MTTFMRNCCNQWFGKPGRMDYKRAEAQAALYEETGHIYHLQNAIWLYEAAWEAYEVGHPKRPYMDATVGHLKWIQYEASGATDLGKLQEIILHAHRAHQEYRDLAVQPSSHEYYAVFLNLGVYYRHLFRLQNHVEHGQQAVIYHNQALALAPKSSQRTRKVSLIELGVSEWTFYALRPSATSTASAARASTDSIQSTRRAPTREQMCDILYSAINHLLEAEALATGSPDEYDAVCLQNLANAYRSRYDLDPRRNKNDLQKVIDCYERALALPTMPTSDKPGALIHLAAALLHRGQACDCDAALARISQVVSILGKSETRNPAWLSAKNMRAAIYWAQYEKSRKISHLRFAIEAYEEVMGLSSESDSGRSQLCFNLAILYRDLLFLETDTQAQNAARREAEHCLSVARAGCDMGGWMGDRLREVAVDLNRWKSSNKRVTWIEEKS